MQAAPNVQKETRADGLSGDLKGASIASVGLTKGTSEAPLRTREILGVRIAASNYSQTNEKGLAWARKGESRAILFANVHMLMEAHDDRCFRTKLNSADMVNSDGMPLVWALRALGELNATRVYGPDTMRMLLRSAERAAIPLGFYGGSETTLKLLTGVIRKHFPKLVIAYIWSPPFRPFNASEDELVTDQIVQSGVRLLFVGLGCPKQEHWIMDHRGRIPAVMLGVGAAFDFLAGSKLQAPRWLMRGGLEWAFRLTTEPRRLTHRYLKHNPRFVALFLRQWISQRT